MQQAVRTRRVDVRKVDGELNPADLFTKHIATKDKLAQLIRLFGCDLRGGRATSAPALRQADAGRTTMADAESMAMLAHVADGSRIAIPRCLVHSSPGGACYACLPHTLSAAELGTYFPRFEAPPDDDHDDVVQPDGPFEAAVRREVEGIANATARWG